MELAYRRKGAFPASLAGSIFTPVQWWKWKWCGGWEGEGQWGREEQNADAPAGDGEKVRGRYWVWTTS